ncbi:hypothetical protein BB561_006882 [Smittium simulii]|uniref:Uncharacterized protein n=1 Tax=Smittium simulii TaxID=133385 RepID=A0A2T9Y0J2_9FUNG|nr:hypothetical protein BB561_006882 [Smittium simulii]
MDSGANVCSNNKMIKHFGQQYKNIGQTVLPKHGCGNSTALNRPHQELKIFTVNTLEAKRYCLNMVSGQAVVALSLNAQKNDKFKIIAWINQINAGRIRSVEPIELIHPEYSQNTHSML